MHPAPDGVDRDTGNEAHIVSETNGPPLLMPLSLHLANHNGSSQLLSARRRSPQDTSITRRKRPPRKPTWEGNDWPHHRLQAKWHTNP